MDSQVLVNHNNNVPINSTTYTSTQRYSTTPNVEIGESKTNLIINYLPQGMTQEEVRSLFASVGEVESCKLVRDKITGQSLGYGFVNYVRDDDALKAVSSFNGLRLQNKTIKVSFARPSNDNIKGSNLYVSGIPKTMTLQELENIFRPFGQIITSRILSDSVTGLSKGVGFVRFDKKNEAENAINTLNNTTPTGCTEQITVKFANNPATNSTKSVLQELEAVQQQVAATNIVPLTLLGASPLRTATIGPIHHTPIAAKYRYSPLTAVAPSVAANQATADYLTTSALLQMTQMNALAGTGYMYLNPESIAKQSDDFSNVAAAAVQNPLAALAATTSPSSVSEPGYSLFVYNLSPETEENLLWQLFGPFGAVLSVKVARDFSTAKCKGYAFVSMMNYMDACNAITALNGTQIGNRSLQVSFKAGATAVTTLAR
ncbi:unnamed protein product [Auanema sp. JU1783]|nr:unnamed protein product [Auanema sp. JU1783]